MFQDKIKFPAFDFNGISRRLCQAIVLAALLLVFMGALPNAQAQGDRCRIWNYQAYFWMPGSGFISGDPPLFDNRNCEGPSIGSVSIGSDGAVDSGDRESAAAKCNAHNGHSNNTVKPFGPFWSCVPGDDSTTTTTKTTSRGGNDDGASSSGGSRSSRSKSPAESGHDGRPPMSGVLVAAELGMNSGIQFQRLGPDEVGIKSVVDRGVLDVVDVWGYADQYFEVCFPQPGKVIFLDASTSPRTVIEISNFVKDGYSCGAMNRAGTMVLVQGTDGAPSNLAIAQSFIDSTTDPVDSAIELGNCEVTSAHNLNLREEPWGTKVGVLPKQATVIATARTESWFKVSYEEAESWIAAWLSEDEGDCDWEADEDDETPALASSRLVSADMYLSFT